MGSNPALGTLLSTFASVTGSIPVAQSAGLKTVCSTAVPRLFHECWFDSRGTCELSWTRGTAWNGRGTSWTGTPRRGAGSPRAEDRRDEMVSLLVLGAVSGPRRRRRDSPVAAQRRRPPAGTRQNFAGRPAPSNWQPPHPPCETDFRGRLPRRRKPSTTWTSSSLLATSSSSARRGAVLRRDEALLGAKGAPYSVVELYLRQDGAALQTRSRRAPANGRCRALLCAARTSATATRCRRRAAASSTRCSPARRTPWPAPPVRPPPPRPPAAPATSTSRSRASRSRRRSTSRSRTSGRPARAAPADGSGVAAAAGGAPVGQADDGRLLRAVVRAARHGAVDGEARAAVRRPRQLRRRQRRRRAQRAARPPLRRRRHPAHCADRPTAPEAASSRPCWSATC